MAKGRIRDMLDGPPRDDPEMWWDSTPEIGEVDQGDPPRRAIRVGVVLGVFAIVLVLIPSVFFFGLRSWMFPVGDDGRCVGATCIGLSVAFIEEGSAIDLPDGARVVESGTRASSGWSATVQLPAPAAFREMAPDYSADPGQCADGEELFVAPDLGSLGAVETGRWYSCAGDAWRRVIVAEDATGAQVLIIDVVPDPYAGLA